MKPVKLMFLILALSLLPATALVSPALAETMEATVFSYDGTDFIRTKTTLMEDGQSASTTKLDQNSEAYKALVNKRSYTGPATLFGQDYVANYAPLMGKDGQLTGAVFVGVPQ